jgi:hypothetical protein
LITHQCNQIAKTDLDERIATSWATTAFCVCFVAHYEEEPTIVFPRRQILFGKKMRTTIPAKKPLNAFKSGKAAQKAGNHTKRNQRPRTQETPVSRANPAAHRAERFFPYVYLAISLSQFIWD